MLRIEELNVAYGGLKALVDVSLSVQAGQFVAIVGPNGAGKTSLFKTVSGTVPAVSGRIFFEDQDLLALPPWRRAHLGIAHVPEGRQVFRSLSVLDNLMLGARAGARADWQRNLEQIYTLFPVLKERHAQPAGTLSGGEQQMLAIGRGLASSPRLLLLDEPSMGLSPMLADLIFSRIEEIHRQSGVTVLLVEQRVAEALGACDYGYVLESGRLVLEGAHDALTQDEKVKQAYLGM
jgi:branched-chain amino acid transport system ATP-binding protein